MTLPLTTMLLGLPPLAALLSLALDRIAPTRLLAIGCAVCLLIAAAGLFLVGGGAMLLDVVWLAIDVQQLRAMLVLDAAAMVPLPIMLGGGGLALLALGLGFSWQLRHYGGLVAALTIAVWSAAIGVLAQHTPLLPIAWAVAACAGFAAHAIAVPAERHRGGLRWLLSGLGGALLVGASEVLQTANPALALLCVGVAASAACGIPPLRHFVNGVAAAPSSVLVALVPCGLPLLAIFTLLTEASAAPIPQRRQMLLVLLGLAALLATAAGALRADGVRRLALTQISAHFGLIVVALGLGQGGTIAALALLANAGLSGCGLLLVANASERRDGSSVWLAPPLLLAVASLAGLPGTLGFAARVWLLDAAGGAAPWAIAPLLAAWALGLAALIAPLAALLRGAGRDGPTAVAIAVAPLLLAAGLAPASVWSRWIEPAALALGSGASPWLPAVGQQLAASLAIVALVAVGVLVARRTTGPAAGPVAEPHALAETLGGLEWLGAPAVGGAAEASAGFFVDLRRVASPLIRRYYLAVALLSIIVVVLLFL